MFAALWSIAPSNAKPAGVSGGPTKPGGGRDGLRDRVLFHGATDVDDVVGDDAEADPAVHSDVALVTAAVEAVSRLTTLMRP
jgi:hypothetical protein